METSRGGIGLCGALFLIFLVLKLTHNIEWSWWWVTLPLWGPAAVIAVVAAFAAVFIYLSERWYQ